MPDFDGGSVGASGVTDAPDEPHAATERETVVVDAEPVSDHEASKAAHMEVETHVRQAIDGLVPGGSRIIDFLQDLSAKE